MKKLLLFAILILASCTTNQEEETNCNCTLKIYQREWLNSNSFDDTFVSEQNDNGCYTNQEALNKIWFGTSRYSILICDEYL